MNKEQLLKSLEERGFSKNIVESFRKVKREDFIPSHMMSYAYEDISLPISEGHSISQPSTIAFMLELLFPRENNKILEIGSGSGYVLALLSELNPNSEIYGLEILERQAIESKKRLSEKNNVHIIHRDGKNGLPDKAPFHRILISAYAENIDEIYALTPQLNEEGIIVAPVRNSIVRIIKTSGSLQKTEFPGFTFVPLKSSR